MIPRYTPNDIGALWTDAHRLETWMRVEMACVDALREAGLVPEADVRHLRDVIAKVDFAALAVRAAEIENTTHHDVVAFLTAFEELAGPASRHVHFGLTSSDVVDTSFAMLLTEATELIVRETDALMHAVRARVEEHRKTPMMGRTHGIHAEPTTFGLKLALMYDEFGRALERLERVREVVAVGKISGAVGTSAHLSPRVEAYVCRKLGLRPAPIATQVVQRDIHAEFQLAMALVGASIERWAVEFRHLQRTEVLEAEEPFTAGQKGSSAMPHKRNPITWERLTGLARVLRGNAMASLENVALWHERDISHSSVERIIFPDSCTLLDYMFGLLTRLMDGIVVYPANMKKNLGLSLGMWNSQTVLLALIKKGLTREAAYKLVQDAAMKTWETCIPRFLKCGKFFPSFAKLQHEITGFLSRLAKSQHSSH